MSEETRKPNLADKAGEALRFVKSLTENLGRKVTTEDLELTDKEKDDYQEQWHVYKTLPQDLKKRFYPQVHNQRDFAKHFVQQTLKGRAAAIEMRERVKKTVALTHKELLSLFPDKEFELLSDVGSSAMIFVEKDDVSKVYKVFIDPGDEDGYVEREVQKIQKLAPTGLSPEFYGFYETENGHKVIVMEKIMFDKDEIYELNDEVKRQEATRIAAILEAQVMYPGDVQFVYDKNRQCVRVVDCGGFGLDTPGVRRDGRIVETITDAVNFVFFPVYTEIT